MRQSTVTEGRGHLYRYGSSLPSEGDIVAAIRCPNLSARHQHIVFEKVTISIVYQAAKSRETPPLKQIHGAIGIRSLGASSVPVDGMSRTNESSSNLCMRRSMSSVPKRNIEETKQLMKQAKSISLQISITRANVPCAVIGSHMFWPVGYQRAPKLSTLSYIRRARSRA